MAKPMAYTLSRTAGGDREIEMEMGQSVSWLMTGKVRVLGGETGGRE